MKPSLPYLAPLLLLVLSSSGCKKKSESTPLTPTEAKAAAEANTGEDDDHNRDGRDAIENEEYRFVLANPGQGWKLQGRKEIQRITPDAQAGMSHAKGLMGVVIVERAVGMSLDAMTDLIIEGMPLENKEVTLREEVEYVGLPAIRYELQGSVSDIPMDYSGRLFLRDGYAYQLITFAARGVATKTEVDKVFENFSLTEGTIEPKSEKIENVDSTGVGWRLKNGVFESAVSGLRVTPTGNWRAVAGAEARRINVDAEVVMVSSVPEAYFFVLPEMIGDAKPEVYREDRLKQTIAGMEGTISQESYQGVIAGQRAKMTTLKSDSFPWTFEVGIGFEKGWAIQATGWYSSSYGEEGKTAVLGALESVTRMSDDEAASLRKDLLAIPDQQNHVGSDHSLRAGVFEDYSHGVRWTKPLGFWEVSVGHAARDINPIAQLYGRYQNSAAHMLLAAETLPSDMTALAYHEASFAGVSANLALKAKNSSKAGRIGSGPALMSDATTTTAGIELYYRVITAVDDGRGIQLHLWGPQAGISEHREALAQVAQNLELKSDLSPTSTKGTRFVEHRLGYSMDLPGQYRYADATPSEIAGIGSFASWGVDGQDWVGLLALCMIEEGQDHEWSMDFMEERIRDSYNELIHEVSAERNDIELFGMPARHLVWKTLTMRLDAYLFRQNKTIYALLATDKDRGNDMSKLAVKGFRFLSR